MTGVDWPRVGIHDDIPAEDYHADPCVRPSLSAGIARTLIELSPRHAWWAHPRLNPMFERREDAKFDLGTAAHSILLQGTDIVEVCDYPDWRTNAAKEQRDQARKAGLIPLLISQWREVYAMVDSIRQQLPALETYPPVFTDGKPERTVIWEEDNGVICRARLDWLRDDLRAIDDYKTTGSTAKPDMWSRRTFWSIGCDVQIAFHSRGVYKVTGEWPAWRYVVCECFPPYAVSVVTPHKSVLELAQQKVEYAIRKFGECLGADRWPAYDRKPFEVESTDYAEADFLKLTYGEEIAA